MRLNPPQTEFQRSVRRFLLLSCLCTSKVKEQEEDGEEDYDHTEKLYSARKFHNENKLNDLYI